MDPHIDLHPHDFRPEPMEIGKITGVYATDHTQNPTEAKLTLYQVTLYRQSIPVQTCVLPAMVPALGQMGGGANEREFPYEVGQLVVMAFLGGDINRPLIMGHYPDLENTSLGQTTAQHPQNGFRANGVVGTIYKNGEVEIKLAADQALVVKDSDGAILMQIKKESGSYQIQLGGVSGLKRLMTEEMISVFNAHTHPVSGAATGPPVSPTYTLTTGAHATDATRAK